MNFKQYILDNYQHLLQTIKLTYLIPVFIHDYYYLFTLPLSKIFSIIYKKNIFNWLYDRLQNIDHKNISSTCIFHLILNILGTQSVSWWS